MSRTRIFVSLCGMAVVVLTLTAEGQSRSSAVAPQLAVDEVLSALLAAEAQVASFTATMVLTERSPLFGDSAAERGTLAVLKPSYVRREIVEPANRVLVVAEGLARLYIPRIKQVREYVLSELSEEHGESLESFASLSSVLRDEFDASIEDVRATATGGPEDIYVLELVPIVGSSAAKRWRNVTLWVREGEWYPPRRIILVEHADDATTIELSMVELNQGLEPEDFELDLPSGVEIVRQRLH